MYCDYAEVFYGQNFLETRGVGTHQNRASHCSILFVFRGSSDLSEIVITAINWVVKCLAVFVFSLICIKKERAFFKGLAAGFVSVFLTMFLFAAIGGGFHLNLLFLPELVLSTLCGGLGALLGAKLRKD